MTNKNANLRTAKKAKNDEFYTQLVDIEKELQHYTEHFKDQIVYCPCDDPAWSNFFKYFYDNFKALGLKKLITTYYDPNNPVYKTEVKLDKAGRRRKKKTLLKGNGDFRSAECRAIMDESDIVVTNPPFSLFREFVAQLMED